MGKQRSLDACNRVLGQIAVWARVYSVGPRVSVGKLKRLVSETTQAVPCAESPKCPVRVVRKCSGRTVQSVGSEYPKP